jgi:hypothetical protein
MKKFADLSKAQKQFCVRILDVCPQYRKQKDLTWKELLAGYFLLKDQRKQTGEKIGFPMWLQKTNIVGRGTYQMPWPTDKELSDYVAAKTAPKAVKVKQPKVAKVKVAKVKATKPVAKSKPAAPVAETDLGNSRLQSIIADSATYDSDEEDFNQILRENGIEV